MKDALFIVFFFCCSQLYAQQKYWVYFVGSPPISGKPALSERALNNRSTQKIPLNSSDYPISEIYLSTLRNTGISIQQQSRWFHAITAYLTETQKNTISQFPFVQKIEPVKIWKRKNTPLESTKTSGYGNSQTQIDLFKLQPLHHQGFTGKNILIGVFDSGFKNAQIIHVFDSLRQQNRIRKVYDFVNHDTTVFDEDSHGTGVLSCIVGYAEDTLIGAAYHAEVALARTETVASETLLEEDNWVAAAEWADSLGVDIISSSLGYNEFDGGITHTYSQLDGHTTVIAKGANMASSKGVIVVVSAGNEGGTAWYHITTPCDADSALCVGAVNVGGVLANFSSIGPNAAGKIKPDICAMGQNVQIANVYGGYQFSSGTSFACPLSAGLAACLKQANPLKTNMEIISAIQMSSSHAWFPDSACGYGIPNAMRADSILKGWVARDRNASPLNLSFIPITDGFEIKGIDIDLITEVQVWNIHAQKIEAWQKKQKYLDMLNQPTGMYVVQIKTKQGSWSKKIIWGL